MESAYVHIFDPAAPWSPTQLHTHIQSVTKTTHNATRILTNSSSSPLTPLPKWPILFKIWITAMSPQLTCPPEPSPPFVLPSHQNKTTLPTASLLLCHPPSQKPWLVVHWIKSTILRLSPISFLSLSISQTNTDCKLLSLQSPSCHALNASSKPL